jgi:hypothetical protein
MCLLIWFLLKQVKLIILQLKRTLLFLIAFHTRTYEVQIEKYKHTHTHTYLLKLR